MEIERLVYGIYPKTNELRLHIGRWEKGTLPDSTLNNNIEMEKKALYAKMNEYNILHTDPLFNWYDIFRPLSLIIDGIELGPLTRFKETNTFYRIPLIDGLTGIAIDPLDFSPLNENPPLPLYLEDDENFAAFLPSPLSFYKMSKTDIKYNDFEKKLEILYSKILKLYRTKKLVLYDPLPYNENDVLDLSLFANYEISLVTTGKVYKNNIRQKIHSMVVDYNDNNIGISKKLSEVPGIKIVDGYNTGIENADKLKAQLKSLNSDKILVSHSEYMDFLPRIIADKKIELISRIGE
ncbi:MAG: hypothetical protein QXZ44_04515 [Ferroplasma sp.]